MSRDVNFAVETLLGEAYRAFRAGAAGGYWLPALMIVLVIDLLRRWAEPLPFAAEIAAVLPASALLQAFLSPFLILSLLRGFQGGSDEGEADRSPDFLDVLRMFLLYLLSSILVLAGLIFYILPGLLISSLLFFSDAALMRQRTGPMNAIATSVRLGRSRRMDIFALAILLNGASLVADLGFQELFADQPILDIALDAVVQVLLFLYGYIVVVLGYLKLTKDTPPPESHDIVV